MSNNMKKTALDRKLDKIRAAEESGKLGTKLTNRTLRKLTSNKLAVIGVLLFLLARQPYAGAFFLFFLVIKVFFLVKNP